MPKSDKIYKQKLLKTMRDWVNDFQTYKWEEAFPAPEFSLAQIKHLLSLVP